MACRWGLVGRFHLEECDRGHFQLSAAHLGRPISLTFEGEHVSEWLLPEAESIPIALSLNELLTNAHKHGNHATPLVCHVHSVESQVSIDIHNQGKLPEGFNLARVPGGVSGLWLGVWRRCLAAVPNSI